MLVMRYESVVRMIHVTTIHRMGLMLFTMQHLQATSSVVG